MLVYYYLFLTSAIQVTIMYYYLGEQSRDVGRIITGAVFGTILAVLIIIIIVLCCVIWRRRYRRKQKIYHVYAKVNEG